MAVNLCFFISIHSSYKYFDTTKKKKKKNYLDINDAMTIFLRKKSNIVCPLLYIFFSYEVKTVI
jgi:hypothetical protein